MKEYEKAISDFLRSATARLTFTHLAIIMIMSASFSIALYTVSASHLDRRLPPDTQMQQTSFRDLFDPDSKISKRIESFLQRRVDQEKAELAWQLVFMNVLVFMLGSVASYILARKALEPIEKVMISKDQFISDASHELRTPLTVLQTSNEVALRKPKLTLKEAKNLLTENLAEVTRLHRLTDGLLRLMKETPHIEKKEASLQQIVSEAFTYIVAKAQEKDITVDDQTTALKLRTDPALLSQVVTILLDNAIKYSAPGTTITLESSQSRKYTSLRVVDTGIGIKQKDIEHIFDRFYRADQSRSKNTAEGYGLGLAIAHKLITSLGGLIKVESAPGKGSVFTILLPR